LAIKADLGYVVVMTEIKWLDRLVFSGLCGGC